MGQQPGQGRGGVAQEQPTNVAFKMERQKVETRQGAIIGQFLIDGEQEKGQASRQLIEIVSAEEREATDSVSRDRIPRQYQKSVKSFFSTVQKALEGQKTTPGAGEDAGGDKADAAAAGAGKATDSATPDAKTQDAAKPGGSPAEAGKGDSGQAAAPSGAPSKPDNTP